MSDALFESSSDLRSVPALFQGPDYSVAYGSFSSEGQEGAKETLVTALRGTYQLAGVPVRYYLEIEGHLTGHLVLMALERLSNALECAAGYRCTDPAFADPTVLYGFLETALNPDRSEWRGERVKFAYALRVNHGDLQEAFDSALQANSRRQPTTPAPEPAVLPLPALN